MVLRVLLADEQKMFVQGLTELLHKTANFEVVGIVDNGADVVENALETKPDLIIMDVSLKRMNGPDVARKIAQVMSSVKIIALTTANDRRTVVEAFKAGMHGYLLKICPFAELQKAIATVLLNRCYLTTEIMDILLEDLLGQSDKKSTTSPHDMTVREREVLQLLSEGNSPKEIAAMLGISYKTVATHREKVMKKLDLSNNVALTRFAIREGLTRL